MKNGIQVSRNPLKSGQCFLRMEASQYLWKIQKTHVILKSGQCFLPAKRFVWKHRNISHVILKSGQCFLHIKYPKTDEIYPKHTLSSNRVNVSYN